MKQTFRKFTHMLDVTIDAATSTVIQIGEAVTNTAGAINDVSKIVKGETAFALREAQHEQQIQEIEFAKRLAELESA